MATLSWSKNFQVERSARLLTGDDKSKFLDIPYYLHLWAGSTAGKRVLDFGCGSGKSAAGVALLHDAALVVGVDINTESDSCRQFLTDQIGLAAQPGNLVFEEITPGNTTSFSDFDVIFSWSVFEHVNNRLYQPILHQLISKMKPGGLFFVQISPLYFSPEGSHLWSIGYYQWEHLVNQTSDVYDDIMRCEALSQGEKDALWSMFRTLNRITAEDLISRFENAGLTLLRHQKDQVSLDPPSSLLNAYQTSALKTHQIVALFQKG